MYTKEIVIRGTNNGYEYFIDKDHPLAMSNSSMVYMHRHVASIQAGRWITSEEHVHHIDNNKVNNNPLNLELLSNKDHAHLHHPTSPDITCQNCQSIFTPSNSRIRYCSAKCYNNSLVRDKTITKELLDFLIPTHSWVSLGKMFGYSDSGIRKRAAALGCSISSRNKR